jgi:hypothetical protein
MGRALSDPVWRLGVEMTFADKIIEAAGLSHEYVTAETRAAIDKVLDIEIAALIGENADLSAALDKTEELVRRLECQLDLILRRDTCE